MSRLTTILASGLACGLCVASTVAHADAPADAIALFDQGIKDLQAGNTELACRELAASLAKYPDSGTKGALAECYTRLGKVASAWNLWKDLADTAPVDLRAEAAANASQLDARLPRYLIKLAGAAPAGLAITINGARVADPTLAVPLPVDPGALQVVATAPDYKTWSQAFQATEGKVTTIEVPALVPLPPSEKPAPTPVIGPTVAPAQPAQVVEVDSSRRQTRHVVGLTVGLAGVAALGVSGYFGIVANRHWKDAKDLCGGSVDACAPSASAPAQSAVDDARSAARISTILAIAGGAAVVVGAVVWITAPSSEHRVALAPTIDGHSAGLALGGSF